LAAINGFNKVLKVDSIQRKSKLSGKVARLAAMPPKLLHAKKKTLPPELRRLGGDASSVWNFCTPFPDIILLGNCWWCGKMLAIFSG